MGLLIRSATPDDAAQLTSLARRAKAHWGYPGPWLAAWAPQLTIAPEYVTQHAVLVAEVDGRLGGMCALEDDGSAWSLAQVWVEPAYLGRGIGRALVERALALVQAVRPGRVVAVADPNAAGFYRRLGAREVSAAPAPMPGAPDRVLPVFEFEVPAA